MKLTKTTKTTGDTIKSTGVRKKVAITSAVLCSIVLLLTWLSSKDGNREEDHYSTVAGATEITASAIRQQTGTEGVSNDLYNGEDKVAKSDTSETETKEKEKKKKEVSYKFNKMGYVSAIHGLNIRKHKSSDSRVIGIFNYANQIQYTKTKSKDWYAVKLDNGVGYISSEFVVDDIFDEGTSYSCYGDTRTPYMSWRTLTARTTPQYKMQSWYATTDYTTGIRMVNGRYCSAIGQAYGAKVGTYFDAILADGTVVPCIMADAKKNQDTMGGMGYAGYDGGYVEMVVETSMLPSYAKMKGDIKSIPGFESPVVELVIYDVNIFG